MLRHQKTTSSITSKYDFENMSVTNSDNTVTTNQINNYKNGNNTYRTFDESIIPTTDT